MALETHSGCSQGGPAVLEGFPEEAAHVGWGLQWDEQEVEVACWGEERRGWGRNAGVGDELCSGEQGGYFGDSVGVSRWPVSGYSL